MTTPTLSEEWAEVDEASLAEHLSLIVWAYDRKCRRMGAEAATVRLLAAQWEGVCRYFESNSQWKPKPGCDPRGEGAVVVGGVCLEAA